MNRFQKLKQNPETARAGQKWSFDEDKQLLDELHKGKSMEEIAASHQRTATSISARLTQWAADKIDLKEMTAREACDFYNVTLEQIEAHRNKLEIRKKYAESKKEKEAEITDKASLEKLLAMIERHRKEEVELLNTLLEVNGTTETVKEEPTTKKGKTWTKEEDIDLLREAREGIDFDHIAKKHGRSLLTIKNRLYSHAMKMVRQENRSQDEVIKSLRLNNHEFRIVSENGFLRSSDLSTNNTVEAKPLDELLYEDEDNCDANDCNTY